MQPIQLSRCSSQLGFFTSVDARSTRSRIRRNLHTQKVYWREIWVGRCHRSCPATASSVRNGPGLLILTRTQEATEALAEEPNGRLRLASGRPDADTVNGSRIWHMRGSGGGAEGGPMVGFASQERHSRTSAGIARKPPLAINHPPSPPPPQDRIAAAALELDQQLMSH